MGFNKAYIKQFEIKAQAIVEKYSNEQSDSIEIGSHLECPHKPQIVIEVMSVWVAALDRILKMISETESQSYSKRYISLFRQRGISYEEYYYLFSDNISEEEYMHLPAYLFTNTYSKDLRKRRFDNLSFTPDSYKEFILSYDLAPTKFLKQSTTARLPIKTLVSHSYCVAKTRSGKTELLKLIIHNLAQFKDDKTSLLILDPHGEFARELRRLKVMSENLDKVIYLDPTIDAIHTPVFNPFQIKDRAPGSLAYNSDTILDAFQQLLRDQAITGNMKRLMRHCIYAMLCYDGTTMMDLLILLSAISRNRSKREPEFTVEEERLMKMGREAPDQLTKRFFEFGWKEVDARTITAVIERIDGILSHPLVRRFVVGKNSFNLEEYLNTGKIVIVNLDFTKLGNIGSEAIGRLIVSEAQNISAKRNAIPKSIRPRTLIAMDECQRFVSAAIERALSEFGKFNTYLFLAHQYIEQIDDGMVKAMLSNTENKIVGRNSAASMGSISSDIGVEKEDLMKVKKYQFYIKAGDQDAFLFQSSDKLLDIADSPYYITEKEAKERVDKYMIEHYYRRRDGQESSSIKKIINEESENSSITLDSKDF